MKRTTLLLGTAAALAACGAARAASFDGWYVSLEGGASWIDDLHFVEQATSLGVVTHYHPGTAGGDAGWAVLATVGYGFAQHWRVELEGGYRHNDLPNFSSFYLNSTTTRAPTVFQTDDEIREFSLMANALYELPLTEKLSLAIGAGAGADHADYDSLNGEDRTWSLAYQGIAGLNYDIGARTQLFMRYRYLHVADPEFKTDLEGSHTCCYNFDDIEKHTVTVGLRYNFTPTAPPVAAPPPPPPPPPPLPAARQFLIFFGFNKCDITAEADGVLGDAAATAKSSGAAAVRIVGHTDSSGSSGYNQHLSECRANAAKSNIVGKGVPADAVSTIGRGESELLVKTGDGVKEPQNRRATVDLE